MSFLYHLCISRLRRKRTFLIRRRVPSLCLCGVTINLLCTLSFLGGALLLLALTLRCSSTFSRLRTRLCIGTLAILERNSGGRVFALIRVYTFPLARLLLSSPSRFLGLAPLIHAPTLFARGAYVLPFSARLLPWLVRTIIHKSC
ncbi:hypothetical protein CB0940_10175 [Cercospora beticola]|uniref:Uncharacterized protein n=1 Tax=Cercospora beticola TaxID=122368 RepID=A0A2G5HU17_CERBT|nr:hypothetical protein CB0940_10175 [Cercospora beticola]PIA96037.1 hypothetical protein CB0940_10175 [Cercospora beticola]